MQDYSSLNIIRNNLYVVIVNTVSSSNRSIFTCYLLSIFCILVIFIMLHCYLTSLRFNDQCLLYFFVLMVI